MRNLVLIVICFLSLQVSAVPAYPGKVNVVVKNGKMVPIYMKGDENFKYALSEDGYTLLSEGNEWRYAEKDGDGNLVPSKFSLTTLEDADEDLRAYKETCPKHLMNAMPIISRLSQGQIQRIGIHNGEPIVGQRRALVVLMQYKDVKMSKTYEDFDALFNKVGFSLDNAKGSVRDFYEFASAGQLDYVSDVYGPFTTLNEMRYYGQNSSRGGGDANALELCLEAIRNLPKDIDLTIYDNDHDGIVDNIHIIFAGYGEEAGASSDAIWSHEYPYKIVMKNEVGMNFAGYSCTPELRGNMGKKISNIGVICHELGHALGANDYYDTNYAVEGSYEGTGEWDIMASGSWNDDGRLPPNFNPYVRTYDFGWEKQVVLSEEESLTLPMHSNNPDENVVYRLNTASSNDYFLLENRQQADFDASLPGKGLMIYHVHPNIDDLSTSNSINDTNPQGFYPVCASGSRPSVKQYGNINTGECPFPGTQMVTTFSPNTNPAAKAWDGSNAYFSLTGIRQQQDGSITFNVTRGDDVIDDPIIDEDGELETIFSDSFESGARGYKSTITMGKKEWICYPNGQIVSNTEMIPAATDGKKLLMLFTGKSQSICEAEIKKAGVNVTPKQKYFLSFDVVASYLPSGLSPVFKFWIKDDNMQIYSQTLTDIKDEWEHIEIPFTSACDSIEYGFYGNIYSGGIFVDNIKLQTTKMPSSLPQIAYDALSIRQNHNAVSIKSLKSTTITIYSL
jgi:M6 family metalloprotease-like protein